MRHLGQLFLIVALSCGPAQPPCSSQTCAGCCDARNVCRSGTEATACGRGGACQSCGLGACFGGVCQAPLGGSGASGGGVATGGGTATGGGASAGGTASDCRAECASKAMGCGLSGTRACETCAKLCAGNPTVTQLDCLRASTCADVGAAMPCGISPDPSARCNVGGGSAGGGQAGGMAGGGSVLQCAGQSCRSDSACCAQYPSCSPSFSACTVACKATGTSCFADSECCGGACSRATNQCVACLGPTASCGTTVACCNGSCTNGACARCGGPGDLCTVNADCCATSYCNPSTRTCFRRLPDGGLP